MMRHRRRRGMYYFFHSYNMTGDISNRPSTNPAHPGLHEGHAFPRQSPASPRYMYRMSSNLLQRRQRRRRQAFNFASIIEVALVVRRKSFNGRRPVLVLLVVKNICGVRVPRLS